MLKVDFEVGSTKSLILAGGPMDKHVEFDETTWRCKYPETS